LKISGEQLPSSPALFAGLHVAVIFIISELLTHSNAGIP